MLICVSPTSINLLFHSDQTHCLESLISFAGRSITRFGKNQSAMVVSNWETNHRPDVLETKATLRFRQLDLFHR